MQHDQHFHAFGVEVDSGLDVDRRLPTGILTVRILCNGGGGGSRISL